eukprot:1147829-Pelagomonas_calceolata.AAC.3
MGEEVTGACTASFCCCCCCWGRARHSTRQALGLDHRPLGTLWALLPKWSFAGFKDSCMSTRKFVAHPNYIGKMGTEQSLKGFKEGIHELST